MKDLPNSGWVEKRLDEVVTVTKTKGGSRPLPYVGLEDISSGGTGEFTGSLEPQGDKSTTFEFGPKHLLYGRLRPYLNKVYRPDFEGHCSSEIFPMLPNDCLDRGYLYHWITSDQVVEKINATSTGARMPRANVKEILRFPIPLPPLEEQQRIVAVLDEAFEGLARARDHAEANLQNARELFALNFEHELLKYKDVSKATTVGGICTGFEYGTSAKSQRQGKMPVLRMGNLQSGEIDWGDLVYTDVETDIKKLTLKDGDVLFNRTNSLEHVGKSAIFRGEMPAIFAGYLIRLHFDRNELIPDFLNLFLNSAGARGYGRSIAGKSVNQANISGSKLKTYPIHLPPIEAQRAIVKKAESIRRPLAELSDCYTTKLHDLDDLRQSILQQAFAGELT